MDCNADGDGCSTRLTIDLAALRANYRRIARQVAPARAAAVVKGDGYGVGAPQVARALYSEGCRSFFVARLAEARRVAAAVGNDADIFVLNGLDPGAEAECADGGYVPVINADRQLARWRSLARERGMALRAAIQIDSGMSRLGLPPQTAAALADDRGLAQDVDIRLVMTHLACADEPDRETNAAQLARFSSVRARFPHVPASIANSGGAFLPASYHHDIVRPGIALFGVAPGPQAPDLAPVVHLEARIIQIREIASGTGVGYGLDHIAAGPMRLATIAIGYADGWPRSLGARGAAWHGGNRLPIVGRVSMDSLTVDISHLAPGALAEDEFVELIGASQSLADVARDAGTIAYEILTRLGRRHSRIYHDTGASGAIIPGGTI